MAHLILRRPRMPWRADLMMREFDRMFSDFWEGWEMPTHREIDLPAVQVHKGDGELTVTAELPGMKPEELDITIKDSVLTINAEKNEEDQENGHREYRRYFRSFTLPEKVDEEKVSASFEDGVLELKFPELPQIESKKIEVKALEQPKAEVKKPVRTRKANAKQAKTAKKK